jgi:hypothetical protein
MTLLAAIAALFAVQDDDVRPRELRELDGLRQEVELLRFFNDLKLTKEQCGKLLEVIGERRRKLQGAMEGASDAVEKVTKGLKEERDALLKGEKLDEEKMRDFHEAQGRLGEVYRAVHETTRGMAAEAKKILDKQQVDELTWLRRHDPPAQVRNWLSRALEQFRKMPEEAFEEGAGEAVLGFFERFPGLPEEDRAKEAERVWEDVVRKARDLSDEEFAKERRSLLNKAVTEGTLGEMAKRFRPEGRPGPGGPGGPDPESELGRFFLQPRVEKILKERK